MAGPIFLDRVKETCAVTGLADVTLTGVVTDFKPFLQAGLLVAGDTFHYLIGPTFNEWEVGLGTLIDATSFARTTIYSSSNADNSKVSFTAGTKYAALIADAAVLTEMLNGLIPVARLPIIPLAKGGTNVDLSAGGGSGFVLKQAAGGLISSAALIASDIPDLAASKIASGVFDNARINWAAPSAIGTGTPAAGTFAAIAGTTGAFSDTITGTKTALGVTPADGLLLSNTTAAAAGAQQISPSVHWRGQGWKTTATAASQAVDWQAYTLPVQGTTAPTSQWVLSSSINGGVYTPRLGVTSAGRVDVGNVAAGGLMLNVFGGAGTLATFQQNAATTGQTILNIVGGAMTGIHYGARATVDATVDGINIIQNNSTTSGAHATVSATVAGAGNTMGDARAQFTVGGSVWTAGIDQSDSIRFKISSSSSLGTNDRLTIDPTTGLVTITGLRINQAPVAATPTPTHVITINLNGTDYRIPCVI